MAGSLWPGDRSAQREGDPVVGQRPGSKRWRSTATTSRSKNIPATPFISMLRCRKPAGWRSTTRIINQRRNQPFGSAEPSGSLALTGDDLPENVDEIPIRPTFLLSDAEERRTKQVEVSFRSSGSRHGDHQCSRRVRAPRSRFTTDGGGLGEHGAAPDLAASGPDGQECRGSSLLMIAMGLGAAHAIQPGHGKTLVTAVALGPGARLYQPLLLGLATTMAHTGSVLLIAAALWFTGATRVADVHRGLTKIAGFAIAAAGFWRIGRFVGGHQEHELEELRATEMSDAGIVGLGLAGGIVPCWDAVGLLVLAAAVGRLGAGVELVLAFSLGMAAVLVAVGWLAWKLKSAVGVDRASRWQRRLAFASALLLATLGLYLFLQA